MAEPDIPLLQSSLLDLLYALRDQDVSPLVGGGFGLYLKQLHLQRIDPRTVIPGELWPRPRATQDLDLFLGTEIIVSGEKMRVIRQALDNLYYKPIPGREYMQFSKQHGGGAETKIDLLTGPVDESARPLTKIDVRRVRSRRGAGDLHAHRTDEALGFQDDPYEVTVDGDLTDGRPYRAIVRIPQPFTYLLMKLFAFRDQKQLEKTDFARHHALDLYRIVAMLTQGEYDGVRARATALATQNVLVEARHIVSKDFASPEGMGAIRLREHELFRPDMDLATFLSVIKELFLMS